MTSEQKARDMLERMGVKDANAFSAGDLVELANLIAERSDDRLTVGAMTKPEYPTPPAGAPFERPVMPCPLCGQQPRVVDLAGWEVLCNCGLALCLDTPDKDLLLAAWNTRASAEVERFRAALQVIATHSVCCDAKHTAVAALRHNAKLPGPEGVRAE